MFLGPFAPNFASVNIAATNTSANVALPAGTLNQLEIYNGGAGLIFINFGGSTVTATSSNFPVAPGSDRIITIPANSTYVAAIAPVSNGTIYFAAGEGT